MTDPVCFIYTIRTRRNVGTRHRMLPKLRFQPADSTCMYVNISSRGIPFNTYAAKTQRWKRTTADRQTHTVYRTIPYDVQCCWTNTARGWESGDSGKEQIFSTISKLDIYTLRANSLFAGNENFRTHRPINSRRFPSQWNPSRGALCLNAEWLRNDPGGRAGSPRVTGPFHFVAASTYFTPRVVSSR